LKLFQHLPDSYLFAGFVGAFDFDSAVNNDLAIPIDMLGVSDDAG
jgi:hypothetical protein